MDGIYKCTVVLPAVTGLPEDDAQNTFYFQAVDTGDTIVEDIDNIQSRIAAFYNDDPGILTDAVHDFISDSISRVAGATQTVFYFSGPGYDVPATWGSPVGVRTWTLGAGAAGFGPLPNECAVVMSYHGDLTDVPETAVNPDPPPATIRPASRLRGRLFIGPLQINASTESPDSGDAIVSSALGLVLVNAPRDLELANGGLIFWVGVSPTTGSTWQVVGGYVDNAFDTQRRRGTAPTARSSWSA